MTGWSRSRRRRRGPYTTGWAAPRTLSGSWAAPPPWVPLAPGAERPRNRNSRPRFWRERTPRSARRTRAPGGTPRSPRPRSRRSRAGSTSTSTSRRNGLLWSAAWSCPASAHGKWWARRSSRPPGATCAGSARASGRRAAGDQAAPDHGVAQGQGR